VDPTTACHGSCAGWGKAHPQRSRRCRSRSSSLEQPFASLDRRDADLAKQLRRAAASVSLDLSEGSRRHGKDRIHLWRIAAGSADEVAASLRVAEAFGCVRAAASAQSLALCDRLLAMIRRLTH
jgi:four helix bundle protein